jgi:diguanylate cyclase (GGDEF)-like protein
VVESAPRLLDAVRRLNQSLDPSQVSLRVCEEAARLLGADTASMFLGSPSDGMRTEATYGQPPERIGEPVETGEGLVGEVVRRDEPMRDGTSAAVPLHWDGRLRAALAVNFEREQAVSPEELDLLEAFGELAAAACRNARAHAGLALVARTDALTGCLNRAAMYDALGRELERCRRKGHALSLVIVDLDEFKQVNERHGHLAGDEVLRQVGESLRESVRAYDLVARYGGDEFAVIAMDADETTATEVARRAVEAIDRALGTIGSAGQATAATAGVAEWQSGDTPAELIGRADRALLHGKHSGLRGRAVQASSLPGTADGGAASGGARRDAASGGTRPDAASGGG